MPPPLGQNLHHDAAEWSERLAAAGGGTRHADMTRIRRLRRDIYHQTKEAVRDDLKRPSPCLPADP
eukprot:2564962-Alexandrium_andersonii.AAC.1